METKPATPRREIVNEIEGALWKAISPGLDSVLQAHMYDNRLQPPTVDEVLSAWTHTAAFMCDLIVEAYQSRYKDVGVRILFIPQMKEVFCKTLDHYQTPEGRPKYTVHKKHDA
jgi:hypothetical protein